MTEHVIDLSRLERVRDGTGHSIFGASGSTQFLNCTGSLIPNLLVKDEGNEDAAYGTVAHAVTELWLRTGRRPDHMIGEIHEKDGFKIEIDESMLDYAQECIDRCELEPGDQLVEVRVDYSDLTPIPNQGGTMDFAAMTPGLCKVKDHKFGKHKTIYAERNFQLMLYAYGIFLLWDWLYDFQEFELTVLQPRIDHYDTWTCTREELLAFAAWAKGRMHECWTLDAPRTPGDAQCEYCGIRTSCAANALMQARLCDGIFGDTTMDVDELEAFKTELEDEFDPYTLSLVNVGNLKTEHIVELHKHSRSAMKFWSSLAKELFTRGAGGEDMARFGLKFVEGRANRKWLDESAAEKLLRKKGVAESEIHARKMVSPSQAEKLLQKAGLKRKAAVGLLEGLAHKPRGKVVLAPLTDRREAIGDMDALVFEDETQPDDEDM